jgi:hypothetical protein
MLLYIAASESGIGKTKLVELSSFGMSFCKGLKTVRSAGFLMLALLRTLADAQSTMLYICIRMDIYDQLRQNVSSYTLSMKRRKHYDC